MTIRKAIDCALLASAAGLALGHAASGGEGAWVPTSAHVQEVERQLTGGSAQPTTTQPPFKKLTPTELQGAARFYYGEIYEGSRVIKGEILRFGSEKAGVAIQPAMPIVMDGGCSVINFLYDIERHRFVRFECNGLA